MSHSNIEEKKGEQLNFKELSQEPMAMLKQSLKDYFSPSYEENKTIMTTRQENKDLMITDDQSQLASLPFDAEKLGFARTHVGKTMVARWKKEMELYRKKYPEKYDNLQQEYLQEKKINKPKRKGKRRSSNSRVKASSPSCRTCPKARNLVCTCLRCVHLRRGTKA